MAEIPYKIKQVIDEFLLELSKNNIKRDRAVLFGNYPQGTFNNWSDIYLAIVSKAFK